MIQISIEQTKLMRGMRGMRDTIEINKDRLSTRRNRIYLMDLHLLLAQKNRAISIPMRKSYIFVSTASVNVFVQNASSMVFL